MMIDHTVQNEINRQLREAATQAMLESSSKKQHTVKETAQQEPVCVQQTQMDGSLLLVCSLVLRVLLK